MKKDKKPQIHLSLGDRERRILGDLREVTGWTNSRIFSQLIMDFHKDLRKSFDRNTGVEPLDILKETLISPLAQPFVDYTDGKITKEVYQAKCAELGIEQ